MKEEKGYIQVYTGNGKGKTTAAIGLALRAIGANKKVFFGQFVKGHVYSEIKALQQYIPTIEVKQYGLKCFLNRQPTEEDIEVARKGLKEITEIIRSSDYDVIVLDEANIAIYYNLFSVDELIGILKQKQDKAEIIITGRYAATELLEFVDLVTEMKEIKHYYQKGIKARVGIER